MSESPEKAFMSRNEHPGYCKRVHGWAINFACVAKDFSEGLLNMLPHALTLFYNQGLKGLPILGVFFARPSVEKSIHFCFGITLGRGLAADFAQFVFWPLGWLTGLICGLCLALFYRAPTYQGGIGRFLYYYTDEIVIGALTWVLLLAFLLWQQGKTLLIKNVMLVALVGLIVALLLKSLFIGVEKILKSAQTRVVQKNAAQAKALSAALKTQAKQRAKSRILKQAQDLIQQMNGSASQRNIDLFFQEQYENIAKNLCMKIDRHFDYLADRACYGDLTALARLKELLASANSDVSQGLFNDTITRIFNVRELIKIKNEVDTLYDKWQYQHLLT